jgi:uncharacterized protein
MPNDQEIQRLPGSFAQHYSVMCKPLGPVCNLNCDYCYYLSKESLLGNSGVVPIPEDVLERYVRSYIESNDAVEIVFDWQGGEPTLLGLDFFRKVVEFQNRHCPPSKSVVNNLQTNGTLLDEEWCDFLKRNGFLVGLSIDGPKELHDTYRKAKGGQPTFDRVMASAKMMKKRGVMFNTLTVINRVNARYPLDVYRFLTREVGARLVQMIPMVEPKGFEKTAPMHWDVERMPVTGTPAARPGNPESVVYDWSVDPEELGAFLCRVFDEWWNRDIGRHFVNLFETSAAAWAGMPAQICVFAEICGKAVVLERDGSLYSCDHFVYPEYRLGNVMEKSLPDMVFSGRQALFGMNKSSLLPAYCQACKYRFACHGECPRNRFVRTPDGEPGLNYFCPGLKRFFGHADERLKELVRKMQLTRR